VKSSERDILAKIIAANRANAHINEADDGINEGIKDIISIATRSKERYARSSFCNEDLITLSLLLRIPISNTNIVYIKVP